MEDFLSTQLCSLEWPFEGALLPDNQEKAFLERFHTVFSIFSLETDVKMGYFPCKTSLE